MRRKSVFLMLLALFAFVAGGWSFFLSAGEARYTNTQQKQNDFIRFHVVANSDSPFDQSVKLKVRDKMLEYLSPKLEGVSSAGGARDVIISHRTALVDIANQVLADSGADYPADIETGIFEFPVKVYGDMVVPAGRYEAVRVNLGQAEGKNWWCVLFPPLCFVDINSTVAVQPVPVAASIQAYDTGPRQDKIEFKWKIAELFHKL